MGEPIKVYDLAGNELTLYGPATAQALIAAGKVTLSPPTGEAGAVVEEPVKESAPVAPALKRTAAKRKGEL